MITINASNFDNFSYLHPYIRYCAEDVYQNDWELNPRKIKDNELLLIVKGTGQFKIEDKLFPAKKGDLIFFFFFTVHYSKSQNLPFSFLCLHFDIFLAAELGALNEDNLYLEIIPDQPIKYEKAKFEFPNLLNINKIGYIESLFRKIIKEWNQKKSGAITIIKSSFLQLITCIFRQLNQVTNKKTLPSKIKELKSIIKNNYNKDLSLKWLAKKVYLHPTYLSAYFKKHMGITISNFINRYRIGIAKQKLINTSEKISSIARETGYENIHYFSKVFKKYEGLTPGQYRKNHQY